MDCFKKSVAAGTAYHLFLFGFTLAGGWLVAALLDVAMAGDSGGALGLAAALAGLLAAGLPAVWLCRRGLGRVLRADRQAYREALYTRIIARGIGIESTGEMDVRLSNDAGAVAAYYQSALPAAAEGTGILLGSAALLCRVHPPLGLLLLGMSLLQLLPTVVYEKWAKAIYEQTDDAEERYDGWLIQGAEGLAALKACRREDWFLSKLEEISGGMVRAGFRAERAGTVETVVFQFVDGALRYGSYVIIGLFVLRGGLAFSDTPVLLVLSGYLFRAVGNLLEAAQQRFLFQAARQRLAEIEPPERQAGGQAPLEADRVRKRYGEKTVLDGVSLTVRAGERVLVAGPNGCGKSTLLQAALGLTSIDGGTVRLGAAQVAFALQEEGKLPLTGRELMEDLAAEGAVDAGRLREHLQGFAVAADLLEKPMEEWSMGQRKKFFLAAALARDAELLILDEPANHLDGGARDYLCDCLRACPGAVLAVDHGGNLPVRWDRTLTLKGDETR